MKKIQMIVHCHHLYTMAGDGVGYEEYKSIAIDGGKILEISPRMDIEAAYEADEVIEAGDYVVLPGLIDAHMHVVGCGLRGLAQDVNNWMMHGAGPFTTHENENTHRTGARLGIAEAIMNGTTTIGNEGYSPDIVCNVVKEFGVRGNIGSRVRSAKDIIYAPGELYVHDPEFGQRTLQATKDAFEKWHNKEGSRIRIMPSPQGCDFTSEDLIFECKEIANKYGTFMCTHLSQGSRETKQMMGRYGVKSIPYLESRGLLDDKLIGVHLTDATDEEVETCVKHGTRMILCVNSIGLIDGIIPPAGYYSKIGGKVALGTDQAYGNNEHNMFNEMRATAILTKVKYEDSEIFPCWKALRMATIESAQALGIDDVVGSLEPGKDADLILVPLGIPAMQPVYTKPMRNIIPNIVYAASGRDVDTVIAGGKVIMRHRVPQTFELSGIFAEAQEEAERIGELASKEFWDINGVNAQYMKEGKF